MNETKYNDSNQFSFNSRLDKSNSLNILENNRNFLRNFNNEEYNESNNITNLSIFEMKISFFSDKNKESLLYKAIYLNVIKVYFCKIPFITLF